MINPRLKKAANRFKEVGGGKPDKVSESIIRTQSAIDALEDELKEELSGNNRSSFITDKIKGRIVELKREQLRKQGKNPLL